MSEGGGVRDVVAARPGFDWIVPLGLGAIWFWAPNAVVPQAADTRAQIYVAAATLAALVLAAAAFVCALVYQSTSDYAVSVRARFAAELRRNWTAIMASTLFSALLPIAALVVDEHSARVATTMTVFALGTVVIRFGRTTWWLRFVLLIQRQSDDRPTPYVVRTDGRRAG